MFEPTPLPYGEETQRGKTEKHTQLGEELCWTSSVSGNVKSMTLRVMLPVT